MQLNLYYIIQVYSRLWYSITNPNKYHFISKIIMGIFDLKMGQCVDVETEKKRWMRGRTIGWMSL